MVGALVEDGFVFFFSYGWRLKKGRLVFFFFYLFFYFSTISFLLKFCSRLFFWHIFSLIFFLPRVSLWPFFLISLKVSSIYITSFGNIFIFYSLFYEYSILSSNIIISLNFFSSLPLIFFLLNF